MIKKILLSLLLSTSLFGAVTPSGDTHKTIVENIPATNNAITVSTGTSVATSSVTVQQLLVKQLLSVSVVGTDSQGKLIAGSAGTGDAVLSATQTFTGANTFTSTTTLGAGSLVANKSGTISVNGPFVMNTLTSNQCVQTDGSNRLISSGGSCGGSGGGVVVPSTFTWGLVNLSTFTASSATISSLSIGHITIAPDSVYSSSNLQLGSNLTTQILASGNNGLLQINGDAVHGSGVQLYDNLSHYVALRSSNTIVSNVTFTLPSADGSFGQFIKTDGSGNWSFGSAGGASGTVNTANQFSVPYYSVTGSSNVLSSYPGVTLSTSTGITISTNVIMGVGGYATRISSNSILSGATVYADGRGVFGGPLSASNLSGTNTGDQTITLTGDVTGSGTGSFAATLAASGVTASTYGSSTVVPVLTVDSKGRVTAVSSATVSGGSGSSLPLPAGATNYVQISPTTQQTGNLSVSSATIGADARLSGFLVTSTGSWANGNAMPFISQYGAYVKLTCGPNAGKEVYCGGANTAGTPNLNCAILDPATNVWTSTTAQTNAHWLGAMLVTPDCNILNIGGLDTSRVVTNKTDVLNTTTWVWSSSATLPAAWAGMGAGVLPNGQILAGGGNKFSTVNYSSAVYVLQAGSYVSTTSLPSTMAYPSVAKMKNGGLLFSGGDVNDSTVGSTSTYFLNGQWITVPGFTGLSTSFNGANEAIDSTGLIYLITGSGPPAGAASQVSEVLNQNVTPLSWVQISSYPLATVCAGVFAEPNDRIICTYGVHSGHFAGSTTYEYDKLTLAWTQAGDLPALKGYVSFNQTGPQPVLNDGRFVLPGGSDDSANSTSSVQIYSPTLYVPSTFTATGIVAKNISVTNNLNSTSITANTQLVVPVQAGALPTVNGDIRYDSTAGAYLGYSGVIGSSIAFVTTLYSSAPINSDILVSTTITTAETAFNTQFTFPANYFTVGKTIRITVGVDYVATATIPTMLAKIRFQKSGPTNVNLYTGGANAGTATAAYSLSRGLSLTVTCAATGSSGQFQTTPIYTAPPFNNTTIAGSVSADTTAAQTLQVTLTFGASSSSNFTRLNSFVIEALN